MIGTTKNCYAEDIEVGAQLDLDGDEYGDNENAIFGYATVKLRKDSYHGGEPSVLLVTSQGTFSVPAGHVMRILVDS